MATPQGVRRRVHTRIDGSMSLLWYARISYRDGQGQRRWDTSIGYPRQSDAESEYRRMKTARETGAYAAPNQMTVGQYLGNHWLPSARSRVKVSTLLSYTTVVERHLTPALGAVRLQRLTTLQINSMYIDLAVAETSIAAAKVDPERSPRKALSAKTIRNIHLVLTKALADAEDDGLVARNPAERAKPPRVRQTPENEIVAWDAPELRTFLAQIIDDRWFPEIRLASMTGMRRAEVLGLRWEDVDLDAGHVVVRQTLVSSGYKTRFDSPKSHRPRSVALDPETVRVLRQRKVAQVANRLASSKWIESDLVFTSPTGLLVHPDSFSQAFERLVLRSRLKRITLHGLRHTHASLLLKSGVSVKVVSERLGHADPGFTLRQYAHVLGSMQEDAALRIGGVIDL